LLNGTSAFTGASTLDNLGTISSTGTSEISGLSSFSNTGAILVQSGTLKIDAAITGAGLLGLAGGTMEFAAASDAHVVFSPSASSTLVLDDVAHFTGSILGISLFGDTIDLAGVAPANATLNYNAASGVL